MSIHTTHSRTRCQQRGFCDARLAAFFDNADMDFPAGKNCRLYRLSRRAATGLRGHDGLSSVFVIVSENTGAIVTAGHVGQSRRGRPYRCGR